MYDQAEREEVENFATYILACSQDEDGDYDIVLEMRDDDHAERRGCKMWCYYFVNHTTRAMYWLQKYDAHEMITGVRGIKSDCDKSRISESYTIAPWLITDKGPAEYAVESEYWYAFISIPRSSSDTVFQPKASLVSVPLWTLCLVCSTL